MLVIGFFIYCSSEQSAAFQIFQSSFWGFKVSLYGLELYGSFEFSFLTQFNLLKWSTGSPSYDLQNYDCGYRGFRRTGYKSVMSFNSQPTVSSER